MEVASGHPGVESRFAPRRAVRIGSGNQLVDRRAVPNCGRSKFFRKGGEETAPERFPFSRKFIARRDHLGERHPFLPDEGGNLIRQCFSIPLESCRIQSELAISGETFQAAQKVLQRIDRIEAFRPLDARAPGVAESLAGSRAEEVRHAQFFRPPLGFIEQGDLGDESARFRAFHRENGIRRHLHALRNVEPAGIDAVLLLVAADCADHAGADFRLERFAVKPETVGVPRHPVGVAAEHRITFVAGTIRTFYLHHQMITPGRSTEAKGTCLPLPERNDTDRKIRLLQRQFRPESARFRSIRPKGNNH